MSDWKREHANEAERFADHRFVDEVLTEFASNMGFARKGLPEYGLQKIVSYVAQTVLARARGFEPERLTMSEDEYMSFARQRVDSLLAAEIPVVLTDGQMVISLDGSDRPVKAP